VNQIWILDSNKIFHILSVYFGSRPGEAALLSHSCRFLIKFLLDFMSDEFL
jgi:hypothetical protein